MAVITRLTSLLPGAKVRAISAHTYEAPGVVREILDVADAVRTAQGITAGRYRTVAAQPPAQDTALIVRLAAARAGVPAAVVHDILHAETHWRTDAPATRPAQPVLAAAG